MPSYNTDDNLWSLSAVGGSSSMSLSGSSELRFDKSYELSNLSNTLPLHLCVRTLVQSFASFFSGKLYDAICCPFQSYPIARKWKPIISFKWHIMERTINFSRCECQTGCRVVFSTIVTLPCSRMLVQVRSSAGQCYRRLKSRCAFPPVCSRWCSVHTCNNGSAHSLCVCCTHAHAREEVGSGTRKANIIRQFSKE